MRGSCRFLRATHALLLGLVWLNGRPASSDPPPTLDTFLARSASARQQGDAGGALDALASAHRAYPEAESVGRALETLVGAGLPPHLAKDTLAALPVTTTLLPDGLGVLTVPKAYLPTLSNEPQHGWTFRHITYVYVPDIPASQTTRRLLCRVHFTVPGDARLAGRFGGLLALVQRTLTRKTGRPAANGTEPFDIWLCRGGQTGGEQWRSNLYFYDLDAVRSSIEWVREIVHEYSHLALPPIGGYDAPEYWANGYLGERLIIRWLQRQPSDAALVERVWGDFSGAVNFDRILIKPALALYKKIGPNPRWLARRDELGMRYLIGQTLTGDDKYGARRVGDALARLPRFREARPADLADALTGRRP